MLKKIAVVVFGLFLTACVSTSEVQLSQNVWQIEANGSGGTRKALFNRAASLTLEKGYTHFIMGPPQTSSQIVTTGRTHSWVDSSGNIQGGQPINRQDVTSVALVQMSNSPAGGAIDAAKVVAASKK